MKWVLILFLITGEEKIYGGVEKCEANHITNVINEYIDKTLTHPEMIQGWGCYDKKTFLIRQNARKNLGLDV